LSVGQRESFRAWGFLFAGILTREAHSGSAFHSFLGEERVVSATYLIRANPRLTYAQKPRTETEEKARYSERAKEAVR
jgi:hypothetical protein